MTRPIFTLDDIGPKQARSSNPFAINLQQGLSLPKLGGGFSAEEEEQFRLQEVFNGLLPSQQEVISEKEKQEEEESLLFQILDLPSKLLGFYSVTGFLDGITKGDPALAFQQFAQGSPVAFVLQGVLDAADAGVKITEKKRFSDVSINMFGQSDGWGRTVLNLMGDILLDPSTWIMPFGAQRKLGQAATRTTKQLNERIAKELATYGGQKASNEVLDFATSLGFNPINAQGMEKFHYADQFKGVIFDERILQFRKAVSLREKVKSGLTSAFVFQVPFYEKTSRTLNLLPGDFDFRIAGAIERTGKFLMDMPVLGPVAKRMSAQLSIRNPQDRAGYTQLLREKEAHHRELFKAGVGNLQETIQEAPELLQEPAIRRVLTDLMDSDAVNTLAKGRVGFREALGEANHFGRVKRRQMLFKQDEELGDLYRALEDGSPLPDGKSPEDVIKELYEAQIPFSDDLLQRTGLPARPGVELFAQGDSFADYVGEAIETAGASGQKLEGGWAWVLRNDQNKVSGPFINRVDGEELYLTRAFRFKDEVDPTKLKKEVGPQLMQEVETDFQYGRIEAVKLRLTKDNKLDLTGYSPKEKAILAYTLERSALNGHGIVKLDPQDALRAMDAGYVVPRTIDQTINELAPFQRKKRLDAAEEALGRINQATGKQLKMEDVAEVADKWRRILSETQARELHVELMQGTLEPYFPRSLTEESRFLIDTILPEQIKIEAGDAAFRLYANFTRNRKFSDLSTTEVNLMMGMIGTTKGTNLQGHEVLWDMLMGNERIRKRFAKEAPDAYEFFQTDAVAAVYRRLSESADKTAKYQSLQTLVDERMGFVKAVADSSNPAEIDRIIRQGVAEGRPLRAMVVKEPSQGSFGVVPFDLGKESNLEFLRAQNTFSRSLETSWTADLTQRLKEGKTTFADEIDEIRYIEEHIRKGEIWTYEPRRAKELTKTVDSGQVTEVIATPQYAKTMQYWARGMYQARNRRQHYTELRKTIQDSKGKIKAVSIDVQKRDFYDFTSSIDTLVSHEGHGLTELSGVNAKLKNLRTSIEASKDTLTGKVAITKQQFDDFVAGLPARAAVKKNIAAELKNTNDYTKAIVSGINKQVGDVLQKRIEMLDNYLKQTTQGFQEGAASLGKVKESLLKYQKDINADNLSLGRAVKAIAKDLRRVSTDPNPVELTAGRMALGFQGPEWGAAFYDRAADIAKDLGNVKPRKVYFLEADLVDQINEFHRLTQSPDGLREIMWPLDRMTSLWKAWTVLPFPQSAIRDTVSNVVLLAMGGFKHHSAYGDANKFHNAFNGWVTGKYATEQDAVLATFGKGKIKISDTEEIAPLELMDMMYRQGILNSSHLREEFTHATADMLPGSLAERVAARTPKEATNQTLLQKARNSKLGKLFNFDGVTKERFELTSPVLKWASGGRERLDNFSKIAGYIDALRRGMDFDEAAMHVRKFTYTPGNRWMSSAEKYYLRRAIPFYNWVRFSTELMVNEWATNPKWFTTMGAMHYNLRDKNAQNLPEEEIVGRYAERLGFPVWEGDEGPMYMILDGYIPHADLPALGEAILGLTPLSGVSSEKTLNYLGEKLTPALRTAFEVALNKSFYFNSDIERFEGEQGEMFGIPMSKKSMKAFESLRLLKAIDDLNVLNLQDFAVGFGDAVARTSGGKGQSTNMFLRWIGGPFGGSPRFREFNAQGQLNYATVKNKIEASRQKVEIRRRINDPRPSKQAEIGVLQQNLKEYQAKLLRLEDFRRTRGLQNPEDK